MVKHVSLFHLRLLGFVLYSESKSRICPFSPPDQRSHYPCGDSCPLPTGGNAPRVGVPSTHASLGSALIHASVFPLSPLAAPGPASFLPSRAPPPSFLSFGVAGPHFSRGSRRPSSASQQRGQTGPEQTPTWVLRSSVDSTWFRCRNPDVLMIVLRFGARD